MKLGICLNGWWVLTYKSEKVNFASEMSFPDACAFHSRSYYEEQFVKLYAPPSQFLEYASSLCDSCQSSDHDTNLCPRIIFMVSRLEQLGYKMKNYRESREDMTFTLVYQFS